MEFSPWSRAGCENTRTRIVGVVILLIPWSGCVGEEDAAGPTPTGGTSPTGPTDAANPFATAPTWVAGKWWKYAVTSTMAQTPPEPSTLIVTDVQSDDYVVDTTSRMQAAFDAETDISYIGPIRKTDLAGRQNATRVEFFRFPLKAGDEWDTFWDQTPRTIKAIGGTGDDFELEAWEGGKIRVRYSYRASVGFFGHLDFLDPAGETTFALSLQENGEGYTGAYVRVQLKTLYFRMAADFNSYTDNPGPLQIAQGTGDLVLRYAFRCAQPAGSWFVSLRPGDSQAAQAQSHQDQGPCPRTHSANITIDKPFVGQWNLAANWNFVTGPNFYRLTLLARTYNELQHA